MKQPLTILKVALASPLPQCFDYIAPENIKPQDFQVGQRVLVPFGKQEKVAILIEVTDQTDIPLNKLKSAIALLEHDAVIDAEIMQLALWASRYYQHSLGEVLFTALPSAFRKADVSLRALPDLKSNTEAKIPSYTLNQQQQQAVTAITNSNVFECFLLEGVTGSGKTEVYLQAIDTVLQLNKQALVLVPEIGLTPQTLQRFSERFSVPVVAIHSKMTPKQRLHAWHHAKNGTAKIIIGTRSSVWTPLPKLGMIVLDEEHDLSFKQQSNFRYSARDVAIMRAKQNNIPIVLGSATPSLESLNNALSKRYHYLKLTERAGVAIKPQFNVIDIRHQILEAGLSKKLLDAMQTHLSAGGQVLLFLNRRGFAPTLLCHECGWIAGCPHCDSHLTYHTEPARLFCHHCGTSRPHYGACLDCKSNTLMPIGLGTERIEKAIEQHFPQKKLLRIDRDSTRNKGELKKLLDQIHSGESDIMIGTQMLAKGHHFPKVTMVAIIDADSGLFSSDFRALERMGQLITQVSGRAGREEHPGAVYIQTHQPEHPALKQLILDGYPKFAESLLEERRSALLPPFSHFALLRADAKSQHHAHQFLQEARDLLGRGEVSALGPIPSFMSKKAGRYQAQLLVQAEKRAHLQQVLSLWQPRLSQLPSRTKVRWSLDVDPQEL